MAEINLRSITDFLFRKNVKFNKVDIPIGNNYGLFSSLTKSSQVVNVDSAKKISTYYTCIKSISEDIAKQRVKVLRNDSKFNKSVDNGHIAYKLLNLKPNAFTTPLTFRETIISEALERGNGYALIERDGDGYPIAIYNLDPMGVVPQLINRKLYYIINDPYLGVSGTYSQDDVFHIRGMGTAYIGISVLKWASLSIGKALATQEYASEYFNGGANLTGLLSLTNANPSDENVAKKVKSSFVDSYKNDGLGVIGGAATFTKMNFSANEAQMLETQEFNVNDVCRWFRFPLSKVQKSEQSQNIEALNIEYVNDCLSPWQIRFEQECERKLFTEKEQPMYDTRFDNAELLRGDSASQERHFKTLYYCGAINANEIRASLNMNTIGPEGDVYFNPVNMIPNEYLDIQWSAKKENIPTGSADPSGSGASNNNINANGS